MIEFNGGGLYWTQFLLTQKIQVLKHGYIRCMRQ